jgi:hypothetical protein
MCNLLTHKLSKIKHLFLVYIETARQTNAGSANFNLASTVAATQTRTWKVMIKRIDFYLFVHKIH